MNILAHQHNHFTCVDVSFSLISVVIVFNDIFYESIGFEAIDDLPEKLTTLTTYTYVKQNFTVHFIII